MCYSFFYSFYSFIKLKNVKTETRHVLFTKISFATCVRPLVINPNLSVFNSKCIFFGA